MRQEHRYGEKAFIDYSDGLSIVDPLSGELTLTQLFLAVWGASNYTYAEATLSQTLPEWIGSHRWALEYFGCVPHVLVLDYVARNIIQDKVAGDAPEKRPGRLQPLNDISKLLAK